MRLPSKAVLLAISAAVLARAQTPDQFRQDFDAAWRETAATYAYFDTKATSWADVPKLYAADLEQVTTRDELVALLERVLDELYDPHAQLTMNLATSPRLVPSGTDLWAEWQNGQAVITDVRSSSDAQRAGIRPNDIVVSINNVPIVDAVEKRLGRSYSHAITEARDWALRAVLAGRHNTSRLLQIRQDTAIRSVELAARDQFGARSRVRLSHSWIAPGIGHIRFNDSLGDSATVAAFDRALEEFREARGLILDLRNTPSGGNNLVAEGILGRFVTRPQPYQRHLLPSTRRSWLQPVHPRGDFIYGGPVAVLVGHWTGSMGEGLAIGFDATGRGTVIGTGMAGLVGATYRIVLPRTGIGLNLPAQRLYHVNGTPRELFRPRVPVDVSRRDRDEDPFVTAALHVLTQQ